MKANSGRIGGYSCLYLLFGLLASGLMPFDDAGATTFTRLYVFKGGSDGALPSGALIADANNNLYGETIAGGSKNVGTVFKFTTDNTKTILYSFKGGADGEYPEGGLVMDKSGNLYGTTAGGGKGNGGTIFELNQRGTKTILSYFGGGSDGSNPVSGVIIGPSDALIGTTLYGGGNGCSGTGCGTLFKFDPNTGQKAILHTFQGRSDGAFPADAPIADSSGNFFGTTLQGGNGNVGTVFEYSGTSEAVLYAFQGGNDGAYPVAGLNMDANENLYGTTEEGGSSNCSGPGCGTVFKLTPSLSESVLHAFQGLTVDGAYPFAGVTIDTSGNLFGTTCGSGKNPPNCNDFTAAPGKQCSKGCGSGDAYEIPGCCKSRSGPELTPGGLAIIHVFGGTGGSGPSAAMLLVDGLLYGTTEYGGVAKTCASIAQEPGCGVIFKLAP